MCFSLTRSSYTSSTLTILVAVLLVLASWSGFFISPTAAKRYLKVHSSTYFALHQRDSY